MVMSVDTVVEHKKKHGATYMINLFGSVIPIIMFLVYASTQLSGLASETEVANLIATHDGGMHPSAEEAVGNVQGQLNSILANQIEVKIEKNLKIVCENPHLRDALESTIKGLIRDYNKVSDVRYVRPSCQQLGVV